MTDGGSGAGRASTRVREVVGEDLFRFLVELEIEKASRLQYCVSVVCLTPDVPSHEADPAVTRRLAEVASRNFRAGDVVATLSASSIGLLLIDAEPQTLPRIFGRTTEELSHPLPADATPGSRVSWSAGGSCYPLTAMTGAELLRQASELMTQALREGGGRLCLPTPAST